MKLYIKNMVCPRCIKAVKELLINFGIKPVSVELGEAEIEGAIDSETLEKIRTALENEGFELLEDEKGKLTEAIKTEIISVIQKYKNEDLENMVFSSYLSDRLGKDYTYLSSLFSKMEGSTIEHFIILQKIEKAKELLRYGELTLSEIAWELGYSSVQHLSRQFRLVTGMTASEFKNNISSKRKPIDGI